MDMDDLFVPEPLHRHIMLSASTDGTLKVTLISQYGDMKLGQGTNRGSKPGKPQIIHNSLAMG